jgi:hypothetical protein
MFRCRYTASSISGFHQRGMLPDGVALIEALATALPQTMLWKRLITHCATQFCRHFF